MHTLLILATSAPHCAPPWPDPMIRSCLLILFKSEQRFWKNRAGLGLVDTLLREGRAPQGGVKDTWIFPNPPFIIYNVSCQVLHCRYSPVLVAQTIQRILPGDEKRNSTLLVIVDAGGKWGGAKQCHPVMPGGPPMQYLMTIGRSLNWMACQGIANYADTVFPGGYSWAKVGRVNGFLAQYVFSQSGWQAGQLLLSVWWRRQNWLQWETVFALRVADWQQPNEWLTIQSTKGKRQETEQLIPALRSYNNQPRSVTSMTLIDSKRCGPDQK